MDRPSTVQIDPDPVLLIDGLRRTDRPEEIVPETGLAETGEKGAAPLRGRVRKPVARHLARIERGDQIGQRQAGRARRRERRQDGQHRVAGRQDTQNVFADADV
ncbi:hypothetical protein GOFOIKOB_6597 [Methylobacterium tardum]|nr:hypothetical protein GOFOIKOB_6597 [Methylobacterium tardum]